MVQQLEVWLSVHHVGSLTREHGELSFQYCADWLQYAKSIPLSQSLPLQEAPFKHTAARPFFAGLLPVRCFVYCRISGIKLKNGNENRQHIPF